VHLTRLSFSPPGCCHPFCFCFYFLTVPVRPIVSKSTVQIFTRFSWSAESWLKMMINLKYLKKNCNQSLWLVAQPGGLVLRPCVCTYDCVQMFMSTPHLDNIISTSFLLPQIAAFCLWCYILTTCITGQSFDLRHLPL